MNEVPEVIISDTSNTQYISESHDNPESIPIFEIVDSPTCTDNSPTDITPDQSANSEGNGNTPSEQQHVRVLPPRMKQGVPPERYSPTKVSHSSRYLSIYDLT